MKPIILPANQPRDRFYAGGAKIAAFRGDTAVFPNTPEDWVASVTTVRGETATGLSVLPDGRLLADAIAASPREWLGKEHLDAYGADPNLLVKLLDAGQRLPVHAHPDDAFASTHLGAAHGKAEAWYILHAGEIHLGLAESISASELLELVEAQGIEALLPRMHTFHVEPGDTVFVPPGLLHAIGRGILLVEVQQPEDLSILLEWKGFDLDGSKDGHLGLGFETALEAVERSARTPELISALVRRAPGPGRVLVAQAEPFFLLDLIGLPAPERELPPGFGVIVVLSGSVTLQTEAGDVSAKGGSTIVVPAAAGQVGLRGEGSLLLCRPPAAGTRR